MSLQPPLYPLEVCHYAPWRFFYKIFYKFEPLLVQTLIFFQATKKGVSASVYGTVLGYFNFAAFIFSLIINIFLYLQYTYI